MLQSFSMNGDRDQYFFQYWKNKNIFVYGFFKTLFDLKLIFYGRPIKKFKKK